MEQYKVVFLPNATVAPKGLGGFSGKVDGVATANEMEALLLEKAKEGYDVVNIVPNMGNVAKFGQAVTVTVGYMVTFRKKSEE